MSLAHTKELVNLREEICKMNGQCKSGHSHLQGQIGKLTESSKDAVNLINEEMRQMATGLKKYRMAVEECHRASLNLATVADQVNKRSKFVHDQIKLFI